MQDLHGSGICGAAAAVDAALVKARDYAAALGGGLLRIEHVADVGLLGDRGGAFEHEPPAC